MRVRSFLLCLVLLLGAEAHGFALRAEVRGGAPVSSLAPGDHVVVDVFLDAEAGLQIVDVAVLFDDELSYDMAASAGLPVVYPAPPASYGTTGALPGYILYAPGMPPTALYPSTSEPAFPPSLIPPPGLGRVDVEYASAPINAPGAAGTDVWTASLVFEVDQTFDTAEIALSLDVVGTSLRVGGVAVDPATVGLSPPIQLTGQAPPVEFAEVGAERGLGGDAYASALGHSLAPVWIDYDGDGLPDLFVPNGAGLAPHLFRNAGEGSFARVDHLLPPPCSSAAPPCLPDDVDLADAVFADYDDDGDPDIYIATDGVPAPDGAGPPNILLRNLWEENGGQESTPLFVDVAAAAGVDDLAPGSTSGHRSSAAAWLDYDRDGHLDLYVCHGPGDPAGAPLLRDRLYRNLGDGSFADVTAPAGIDAGVAPALRRPCAALLAAHLDGDRWPDLWIASAGDQSPHGLDRILQNRIDDGFVDRSADSPGVVDDGGLPSSLTVGDPDLDGDWDVYVADASDGVGAGNALYLGTGNGIGFQDDSASAAGVVAAPSWGAHFLDVDNDGWEDLFVATADGNDRLYYNRLGGGTFTDVSATAGFTASTSSRGSAYADFDEDGDLDIAVVTENAGLLLYENRSPPAVGCHRVEIEGAGAAAGGSSRDAIGTVVRLQSGDRWLMRQVTSRTPSGPGAPDAAYVPVGSRVLHFGAGSEGFGEISYIWPGAVVRKFQMGGGSVCPGTLSIFEEFDLDLPTIDSPEPGSVLPGPDPLFVVTLGSESLQLGTTPAAADLFDSGPLGVVNFVQASGLPVDGTPIFARVEPGNLALPNDFEFTAALPNYTPTVSITSPLEGLVVDGSAPVDLAGAALDPEDGDLSATLSWVSSIDGPLGSGAALSSPLTPGVHTIAALATDGAGVVGAEDVVVVVPEPEPTVMLIAGIALLATLRRSTSRAAPAMGSARLAAPGTARSGGPRTEPP